MKIIASPNDAYECGWSGRFAWYAIRTVPRREMAAAEDLRELGVKAFVPVEIVKRRVGRGAGRITIEEIEKPFFPSYLFAQAAMDVQSWLTIRGQRHVCEVLSAGIDGRPTPVPDAAMRHLIEHGPFREPPPPPPRVGDVVQLSTGPFAGMMTKITKVDRGERISVLVQFMGADRSIDLRLSDVERLQDGSAARRSA